MSVWKPQHLAIAETGLWQLGPLTLYVQRLEREWRVAHCREPEREEERRPLSYRCVQQAPPAEAVLARYASELEKKKGLYSEI